MRLKEIDISQALKSVYVLNLLLSLSRACKILRQILCEEQRIVEFLKSAYSDLHIRIVANLSVDCKTFIKDYLPAMR
jgi:hypothetical protein